ncbi:MAG: hypothetical protein J6T18_03365 [Bacteroidaceae bacterium]|nr:hypothetical protein [Bacteroidaceae bacterium]
MASLNDLILQQVKSAAGGIDIPSGLKDQIFGGLTDSVLGSLKQTAAKSGGIDQITQLVTGKTQAASSPVTALATQLFTKNVMNKLNLGSSGSAISGLIPTVMGKLSNIVKDRDGDGDIDLKDLLAAIQGGNNGGGSILGSATGILGGLFRKK